ncbi:putative DUF349 domain-containing protein [Gammaproteobacteria bacterium]
MILKNLFKPRWQHSNPRVRRQALEELASDHEVLTQIARRDPDPALRILAIERLTDLTILDLASRADTDPRVRERAVSRLREVFTGAGAGAPSLTERLVWLERTKDPTLLVYLARHGVESTLRSTVLERITDDEVLAASAVADPDTRVRALAAARLQNRTLLERVAKLSRNRDKGVHRIVQERLTAIIEEEERPRRQRAARESLCADVEALVRRGHWHDAATPLERLENRWAAAEGTAPTDLAERFTAAVAIIRRGVAEEEERRREQARIEEALVPVRAEKQSLCMAVENLADDLTGRSQLGPDDATVARTLLRTVENGWAQSAALPDPEESRLKARFHDAVTRIRARLGDLLRRSEQLAARRTQCERAEQALAGKPTVEESTLKEWTREWQALGVNGSTDDPEGAELAQRFQTAMHQLRERGREAREHREQTYAQVETTVVELEQALEQGILKAATPLLTIAQTAVAELPAGPRATTLKARVEKGAAEIHKLQEWQRWGNVRERERLCTEVEALVGTEEAPEQLATRIREMREEWNRLGPPERESAAAGLGGRFNAACEAAFEPCRIYFAEQARRREEAAGVRTALIARIEAFTAAADWTNMDWKAADAFLQEMREAWRNAGPVDRRASDRLQERFTAALEPLQQEIRREHRRTLKAKENLVARAEAARGMSDLRQAANEIKQLQIEWKSLGHAPRRQEQALWRRLRAAADDVFERRHTQVLAQEAERNAARVAREALCEQIETLAQRNGAELATTRSELATLEQQWATLPAAPREDAAALDNRFRKAVTAYHEAVTTLRRQQAWEAVETLAIRGALCTELERSAETDGDQATVVEAARNRWNALGQEVEPPLTARFERACSRASLPIEQRREQVALEPNEAEALETLCIRLEVFAGVDSPPESARARLSHQVNRLAEGLGQGREVTNPEQRRIQFMELLQTWYATGPIPAELHTVLEARVGRVLAAVRESADYR